MSDWTPALEDSWWNQNAGTTAFDWSAKDLTIANKITAPSIGTYNSSNFNIVQNGNYPNLKIKNLHQR